METIKRDAKLIELAEAVSAWSDKLLAKAPLTDDQRQDIVAINDASREFLTYATREMSAITDEADLSTKQRVRHQLRNYLNIIVGFSRLMVKELPDNLLMDMITIRKIHDTGEMLMAQVDTIQ